MLTDLRINGLALLHDVELELGPGLTAITGETGAGKTMLLTALRLLTGGRAEPKIIKPGRPRTEVDGILTLPPTQAAALEEAGIDVEDSAASFSRTVTPSRSRAAISGRPVTARMLQETAGNLITIHGQADQWKLKSPAHQRDLLDSFAPHPHAELLADYQKKWQKTSDLRRSTAELEANKDRLEVELRYLQEVTSEVTALDPAPDEEDTLDAAIERLANIEELRTTAETALAALTEEGRGNAGDLLGQTTDKLLRAVDLDPDVEELAQRARALESEVLQLGADLRAYSDTLFDDPEELARLHQRRATLADLCRGRAQNAAELLVWTENAQRRIEELKGVEGDPAAAQEALRLAEEELAEASEKLTDSRKAAALTLESQVNEELAGLALANAALHIEVTPTPASSNGADRVQMLLQPHPSAPATPLGEGASGGELSRVMLALEVVLADGESPQTMVFDEVDAGIGGLTANQVGKRLAGLARFHQVIVVTHLPQVAALADANFVVEKVDGSASVRRVSGDERTDEIVRMLGGDDGTGAARRHALELEKALIGEE